MDNTLENEILKNLHLLEDKQQNKVLRYIKNLLSRPPVRSSALDRFVGILDKQEAETMKKTIEDGCENIDRDEW